MSLGIFPVKPCQDQLMSLEISVVNVENKPIQTEFDGGQIVTTVRIGVPGFCFLRELIVIDGLASGTYRITAANPAYYKTKAEFDAAAVDYWITTLTDAVPFFGSTKPGFQREDLGVSVGLFSNQPTGVPSRFNAAVSPSLFLIVPDTTSLTTPVKMRVVTVK
jgi:hypothetical protein